MSAPLEVTGLGRSFGHTWALRHCSLRIEPGSITALVGPNGAGKSTLLQLAVGLLTPTEGTATIFGQPPATSAAALAQVGYLAQDHPLYRGLTVGDLLRMGRGMNPTWDHDFALGHLAELGIPLSRKAGGLSGGQQAQVALTLTLAKRPALLILDEPVASLDPLARRDFMATVLADAADRGTTVVLSSHVISELERVSDHLVVLGSGQVQVDGAIDDLLDRHRILVGPGYASPPTGLRHVLSEHTTERQTTLIVELDGPVQDPRWTTHPLSLEDLVLAYLRDPDAGTRTFATQATGSLS
ncbi:ABC transporter ATP-binding protein [Terrabacter sp. Ter38]|uniref:ABC transporter ATP-binding protein n=1 Tax=Terrabacter sp. Ter38 TaxID=2926030 RepID=UPI0021175DCE|nr:ABC transporter ATP-binding protein [Terrabacter sp. Ter38]